MEIEKTLPYRTVGSARDVARAYTFKGSYAATFDFVIINNTADTLRYVANEYGWYRYCPPAVGVWRNGVTLQNRAAGFHLANPSTTRLTCGA